MFVNLCTFICKLLILDYRMTPAQRAFSGNRCSDHLTVLNAFHQWENLFRRDIDTTEYCARKMLSLPALTTTADVEVLYIFIQYLIHTLNIIIFIGTIKRFIYQNWISGNMF